jgi:hypothetical protein
MITDKEKQLLHILIKNEYKFVETYTFIGMIKYIISIFINHNLLKIYESEYINNLYDILNEFGDNRYDTNFKYKISIYFYKDNNKYIKTILCIDEFQHLLDLIKSIYINKNYNDIKIEIIKNSCIFYRYNGILSANFAKEGYQQEFDFYELFDYNRIEEYLLEKW